MIKQQSKGPLVYGTTFLPSDVSLTAGSGVYQHVTGLQVVLPMAGTYEIMSCIRSSLSTTGAGNITAKLWDNTAGVYILATEALLNYLAGTASDQETTSSFGFVTVTQPTTLIVDAQFTGTGTASIIASTLGQTYLSYKKL